MEGSFLGPKFENNEIRSFLDKNQIPNHFYSSEKELLKIICQFISKGKIIGWFQGRMEFGPENLEEEVLSVMQETRKCKPR